MLHVFFEPFAFGDIHLFIHCRCHHTMIRAICTPYVPMHFLNFCQIDRAVSLTYSRLVKAQRCFRTSRPGNTLRRPGKLPFICLLSYGIADRTFLDMSEPSQG